MAFVDMKLSPHKPSAGEVAPSLSEYEKYPYGLRLRFDEEQVKKIPNLQNKKVGDQIQIKAVGLITEYRIEQLQKDRINRTISIQIQKIDIPEKQKAASLSDVVANVANNRRA